MSPKRCSSCPSFCSRRRPGSLPTSSSARASSGCVKLAEIAHHADRASSGSCSTASRCCSPALFLMGLHSTVFGPVKYCHPAAAPARGRTGRRQCAGRERHLPRDPARHHAGRLAGGKPGAATSRRRSAWRSRCVGYAASRAVPHSPAPAPELRIDWNPLRETWRNLRFTAANRTVFHAVLGISWFWFYGAMFLAAVPGLRARHARRRRARRDVAARRVLASGIGVGSLLCERLSGHKVEIGLVPFGSIGMTLFALDLFFALARRARCDRPRRAAQFLAQPACARILLDLFLIGVFGGFYIVPLYALIQTRTERCAPVARDCRQQHPERGVRGGCGTCWRSAFCRRD